MTRIIDRTPEALARVDLTAAQAVRHAADVVRKEIEDRTPVNTGTGERSYHVADDPDDPHKVSVTNTQETSYLKYVEQGTSKMPARPHVVPGGEAAREEAESAFVETLKETF